eukprot:1586768-Rhodomonas_salina.1
MAAEALCEAWFEFSCALLRNSWLPRFVMVYTERLTFFNSFFYVVPHQCCSHFQHPASAAPATPSSSAAAKAAKFMSNMYQ